MCCDRKESRPFAILCHFLMEIKNIGYLLVADLFILNFSMGDRKLHLSILYSEMFERIASKYVPGRQRIYMGTKKPFL